MNGEEILFIGPRSRGGMNEVLEAYGRMLPGARFVATYHGGSRARKLADFVAGYARAAWLLMTDPKIKIVHIHSASGASFRRKMYFARLARRMARKVVMHVHGGGFRDFLATDPAGITAALNSCDEVICLSDRWREYFISQGVEHVTVVPNPVDYPETVERAGDDGKTYFLFMGILDRAKGVHDLVEAVDSLPQDIKERIVVHMAGTGPEEQALSDSISARGLDGTIVLEGWVAGEKKTELLKRSHCYVLPSYAEGLPVSILEAMAVQMPVIATNVGGIPSIVTDGVNGILLAPRDTAALAAALRKMVEQPEVREKQGEVSREKAARYSTHQVHDTLSTIYSRYGVNI